MLFKVKMRLNVYYMLGFVLGALCISSHFIFQVTLWEEVGLDPHFKMGKHWYRSKATYQMPHS